MIEDRLGELSKPDYLRYIKLINKVNSNLHAMDRYEQAFVLTQLDTVLALYVAGSIEAPEADSRLRAYIDGNDNLKRRRDAGLR